MIGGMFVLFLFWGLSKVIYFDNIVVSDVVSLGFGLFGMGLL